MNEYKIVEYLIEKLERLDSGAVVSSRYSIIDELEKLGIDPDLKISEIISVLKDIKD